MESKPDAPVEVGPEKKPPPPQVEITDEAKTWGMMAHLSALIAILLSANFASWAGPLIIYFVKKDDHPFIEDQAKESLNFQITMFIMVLIASAITGATCGFGAPLFAVPFLLQIIFGIMACMKANNGEYYRYPICIRMIT